MSNAKATPKMIEVVSLQHRRLESTKGFIEIFEPNVPKLIPMALLPEAQAVGIAPVKKEDQPFVDDLTRARVEFQGDIKRSMVFLAVQAINERNNADDFDQGAVPKTKAVSDLLGFEVVRQDVIDLHQAYMQSKSSGVEFALHPASENILRVIGAADKAELLELAEEFGLDQKVAKGKTVRDLRKHLLVMLDGTAVGS